jgi:hypothetical protein
MKKLLSLLLLLPKMYNFSQLLQKAHTQTDNAVTFMCIIKNIFNSFLFFLSMNLIFGSLQKTIEHE